jgi:hypothetical protein
MEIKSSADLLNFLWTQMDSGQKNWFGFAQQRLTGIHLAHQIATNHADKMTPSEVIDYVVELNNEIYKKFIKYN